MSPMRLSTFLLFILCYIKLSSQDYSYEVRLEPIVIDSLGGLHSFAFGTNDEDWLLIGGRLDGLHERQPFAAFDYQGYNNQLIVVNPITEEILITLTEEDVPDILKTVKEIIVFDEDEDS